MLARLSRRCEGDHEHQWLDSGRTRAAEIYPPGLVLEILRGMRDTADHLDNVNAVAGPEDETSGDLADDHALANSGFGHLDYTATWKEEFRDRDIVANIDAEKSFFTYADGSKVQINWAFKPSYKDEYTSEELPPAHIHATTIDELR